MKKIITITLSTLAAAFAFSGALAATSQAATQAAPTDNMQQIQQASKSTPQDQQHALDQLKSKVAKKDTDQKTGQADSSANGLNNTAPGTDGSTVAKSPTSANTATQGDNGNASTTDNSNSQ